MHFHEILSRTDEQPCKQMQTEARSTREATTAARHAGRAAELAWPPSSHADIEKGYVAVEKEIQKLLHDLRRRPRTATQAASLSQAPRIPCRPCGSAFSTGDGRRQLETNLRDDG